MTPSQFKQRFREALPAVPTELDLGLGKFRDFPAERIAELRMTDHDKTFLAEAGLPEDAAPFLSFLYEPGIVLESLLTIDSSLGSEYEKYIILGNNGSGDPICIRQPEGIIVVLNHDNHMQEIFINSSISQFAESLCLFQESINSGFKLDFIAELKRLDARALNEPAMWPEEYRLIQME